MKGKIAVWGIVMLGSLQITAQDRLHTSQIEERNIQGESIIFADDQRFSGLVYENYESRKLRYEVIDGKKNGRYESYYENGQLKRKTTFKNDKYHGQYSEYYENGQLAIETSFDQGRYDGQVLMYFEDGTMQAKGMRLDGEFHGIQESYYTNGRLKSSQEYQFGKKQGAA